MGFSRVVALVPAHDEEQRIADTVEALASVPGVSEVVVVDDGSADDTAVRAQAAGARVLRVGRDIGKGRAVEWALSRIPHADSYVFADGDLGETASGMKAVLEEVLEGRADLAIAVLPHQGGGFGTVKRFAAWAIRRLTDFRAVAPLSGQRAISAGALDACRPIAPGFGMETAMTIDAVRTASRVVEVEVPLEHAATGRDLAGFAHRAHQGWDILRAVVPRALGMR